MKTFRFSAIVALLFSFALCEHVDAQGILKGLGKKALEKVQGKVENKTLETVDKTADDLLDGSLFKKKKKEADEKANEAADAQQATEQNAAPEPNAAAAGKKNAAIAWNNYDFVSGDVLLFEDNLEGEKLGEFPSKWDAFSGAAEVVNFDGQMVMNTQNGIVTLLFADNKVYLTDESTVEFDLYVWSEKAYKAQTGSDDGVGLNAYAVILGAGDKIERASQGADNMSLYFQITACSDAPTEEIFYAWRTPSGDVREGQYEIKGIERDAWHHVAISFNKRAYKVYFDSQRVANIPNALAPKFVQLQGTYDYERLYFWRNVRIAKGAVPLYDRLASEGKIVTYAITFDTGKATVKPESTGEINRITKIMTDDAFIKFEVQGHCDNTGSDSLNDKLSQQRAEAIVAALVGNGIAAGRLTAVGKGSHEPLADNSTPEGRAKNRRVVFVKK